MPSLIRSSRGYGKNNSSQVTDVNAKNTSLLLTGDQTSKSYIADNSLVNADPTVYGDTKPSNLNPFEEGFYSNYFDGNGDYLVVPSNYKTGFLIGDFTIEMWIYPTVITGSHILVNYGTETTSRIQFFINSSSQLAYDLFGTGTSTFSGGPSTGVLLLNTWSHIAFVRSGSTVTAYLNGISQGTAALGTGTVGNGTGPLNIGVNSALNAGFFNGYISNLRVLRSLALYTSNFIPPTQPLTRTSETVLLTCQSNQFIDRSINAMQLTPTGGVRVVPFDPFEKNLRVPQYVNIGSNSVYFDGTGDCLGAESSNGILPADFTVEMWVYLTSSIANQPLVAFGTEVSGRFSLLTNASGQLKYGIYGDGTEYVYTSIAMILNTWTHVAFSRTGTSIYAFINGDSAGTVKTLSGSMGVGTRISVGASAARDSSMTGYLSSVRIVNGTGLYTTAFTPSTTPLTAIANTSLLVCQSSTIVDNGPNAYAITVSGNAAVSDFYLDTPVYKSLTGDDGSISFDGTGDYITIPYDNRYNIPASTPFTFEAWVYTTATTEVHLLNRNWSYGGSFPTIALYLASGTTPNWQIGTGNMISAGIAGKLGQWNHYVWSRDASNVCRIFTNGVESTTTGTNSVAMTATSGAIFIGVSSNLASNYTNGQISNMRFIVGSCIYTANFRPPTEPLTAIPNTVLLMAQSRIPNNNKLFFDDSNAMNTVTPTGNATKTSFSPYGSNWSYSFNGSTDYVLLDGSSNFEFGTGDFTLEAWIYTNTTSAYKVIYDTSAGGDAAGTGRLLFDINTGGYLRLYTDAGTTQLLQSPAGAILPYRWHHVAISRTVSFGRMFVDGNLVASGTVSTNFLTKPSRPVIGVNGYDLSTGPWSGYISNLKAYKGVSLYNSNFTPSTKPSIPTEKRFLGYSGYFDGGSDNLTIPQTFGLATLTTPFTMETWVNFSAFTTTAIASTAWAGSGHIPFVMDFTSDGAGSLTPSAIPKFSFYDGSSWINAVTATSSLNVNTWYHLAFVYTGSTATIYANGRNIGSAARASWTTGTQANFYIGRRWDAVGSISFFNGYISNFRLTIGQALYTGIFTPPTSPFSFTQSVTANVSLPSSSNVVLLACLSSSFIDNSANNSAITVVANASISSYNPFSSPTPVLATAIGNRFEDKSPARIINRSFGNIKISNHTPFENYRLTPTTYSIYFDGTTDVLNIQGNFHYFRNSGANNQGDFCVEGWFYPRKNTASLWTLGNEFPGRLNCVVTSNKLNLNLFGGGTTPLGVVPSNTWSHIAIVRANAIVSAYVNGTLSNSTIIAGNVGQTGGATGTSPLWIGSDSSGSGNFEGYISNFRVIRGTPYYTANIDIPSVPFEAVRGTELLTCQSATIVDNSTTGYTITANGDVKVRDFNPFGYITSPTPIKYDANLLGGSVYFDGTGDYLTVTNSNSLILSNVFTIQGWFYESTPLNVNSAIISKGTATTGWQVMIHNSNTLMFSNATANINSVTPIRPFEWNHFAVVRGAAANRTLLFLNGNLEATGTFTNPFAETNDMYIGSGRVAGANVFTGYISDLRIDAAALYANSFVPSFNSVNTTKNAAFILDKRTAIIDYSLKNSVETLGNVKIKQFSPFNTDGTYSYYLDGTSGYLTVPPGNIANISGSFTLELWYYPITASSNKMLFGTWNNNQGGWGLWATPPGTPSNSQYIFFYYGNYGSNEAYIGATNGAAQLGKWSHIAVTRDNNNNWLFFLDGQRLSTTTFGSGLGWSNTFNFVNTTTNFINIGGASNYATTHGYISNLRFVANSSIYTGNFTPPTAPLPIVQSASANVLAIAPQPVNGYSVFFDGTGDYLTLGGQSDFAFGTNSWTVEFWVYFTGTPGTTQLFDGRPAGTGDTTNYVSIGTNTSALNYYTAAANPAIAGPTLAAGQWYHVAVCRNVTSTRLFVNGTQYGSTISDSYTYIVGASRPILGADGNVPTASLLNGYLTNLRVVKGQAVYTGNFSVPTSPLAITQSSSSNVASIISTIPENGRSVYFDGTGDYISVGGGNMVFAGDYTIECWVYPARSSYANYIGILGGSSGNFVPIYLMSNGTLEGGIWGTAAIVLSTLTVNLNQWNHIALVRSGSSLRFYINGVQDTSYTRSATDTIVNPTIGYTDGGTWLGYISNMRVVNGTALYTANFTLPTTPLVSIANTTLLACQSSTIIDNSANNRSLTIAGGAQVALTDSPFGFSNVRLLTAQAPIIIDNSLNNNSITVTGDAKVAPDGPFGSSNVRLLTARTRNYTDVSVANVRILPVGNVRVVSATPVLNSNTIASNILTIGQSFYFSGTGQDYIALPAGSDTFEFATNDFTVEFWMYTASKTTGEYEIIESGTNNAFCIYKRASSSGFSFRGFANTDVLIATDATLANVANSWVHIAVSRSNIYTKAYVNGVVTANVIDRVNYVLPTTVVTIGARTGGSNYFTGYLADLRVTKGVARYTSNTFTPPNKLPISTSSYKAGTPLVIDAIIVAGGGAGGYGSTFSDPAVSGGGGGGAGGVITTNINVIANQIYSIVIGSGGSATTSNVRSSGSNTTAFGFVAVGGGGGYSGDFFPNRSGASGGSGGGAGFGANVNSANGIIGQGFPGSAANFPSRTTGGSGAGGMAQAWFNGPSPGGYGYQKGGTGIKWVDGNYYGGGGGGYISTNYAPVNNPSSNTALGGGGAGAVGTRNATAGDISTGGGGGGGGGASVPSTAGSGGSGVVVIRYPMVYPRISNTTANVTMTETGDFRYYKFTSSGNAVFPFSTTTLPRSASPASSIVMDYLIIAGGGGGAGVAPGSTGGAGGGAGGLITSTATLLTGTTYTITVGAGGVGGDGTARGANGNPSVFDAFATATGGGAAGAYTAPLTLLNGLSGGSGGGAASTPSTAGAGLGFPSPTQQGYPGGLGVAVASGGGGGAGSAGVSANPPAPGTGGLGGNGGAGVFLTISGSSVGYAGGGGAGADTAFNPGIGTRLGFGGGGGTPTGGGNGGNGTIPATSGNVNTGGGGGGQAQWAPPLPTPSARTGGGGGSGLVILRHPSAYSANVSGTANITTAGDSVIYTFTQSGTITINSAILTELSLR